MNGYEDYYPEPEDLERLEADFRYFNSAKDEIVALFESGRAEVYYLKQLQVLFEKRYFHWMTYHVVRFLKDSGALTLKEEEHKDKGVTHFYIHPSNRYPKRKIKERVRLIEDFSRDEISLSCGRRAEDLFCLGLTKQGFQVLGENVKEWGGVTWEKSGHDLDFVFERDGIFYGCEVKNTFEYIDKEELNIKLEMCKELKLKPIFIVRWAPKSYIKDVYDLGGFSLLYEMKIFDISQLGLVEDIRRLLKLPVDCPRAIGEGTIRRFVNWHENYVKKNKNHRKANGISL
jgi:hypothetical protein